MAVFCCEIYPTIDVFEPDNLVIYLNLSDFENKFYV